MSNQCSIWTQDRLLRALVHNPAKVHKVILGEKKISVKCITTKSQNIFHGEWNLKPYDHI